MLISLNVGLVLWVSYGFMIHSLPIILPNAVTFFLSAPLLDDEAALPGALRAAKSDGRLGHPPETAQCSPGSVASHPVFPYLEGMEVHFTPETEKKLNDLAAQSGRGTADELVQDVDGGIFSTSLRRRAKCSTAAMTT